MLFGLRPENAYHADFLVREVSGRDRVKDIDRLRVHRDWVLAIASVCRLDQALGVFDVFFLRFHGVFPSLEQHHITSKTRRSQPDVMKNLRPMTGTREPMNHANSGNSTCWRRSVSDTDCPPKTFRCTCPVSLSCGRRQCPHTDSLSLSKWRTTARHQASSEQAPQRIFDPSKVVCSWASMIRIVSQRTKPDPPS